MEIFCKRRFLVKGMLFRAQCVELWSHFDHSSAASIRSMRSSLFLFAWATLVLSVAVWAENDAGEDQYYDDYYEDEVVVSNDGAPAPVPKNPGVIGFHKHVGGGVHQVTKLLVDEAYLNWTSEVHDCVKRMDSGILALEPNVTEDEEPDITQQVNDLRKKMEEVVSIAAALANGTDAKASNTTSNETVSTGIIEEIPTSTQSKVKRLSFREKQELRLKERREQEAQRELLRPKFRLGADCETLVCGACKAIVEEFGTAVHAAVRNTSIEYVEEVTIGMCAKKEVRLKYIDLVSDVCKKMEEEKSGYKDALLQPFEQDDKYDQLLSPASMNPKKQKVCVDIGACEIEQFEFVSEPLDYTQEQWDDKCYVCQAFAKDLEERVQLTRHVTEGNIVPIVANTCDRLTLAPHYRELCLQLTKGKLLDDIAWLGKVHSESVLRKAKAEQAFPDKLCEEIDWCKAYIDPERLKEKQAQETMEAVFF